LEGTFIIFINISCFNWFSKLFMVSYVQFVCSLCPLVMILFIIHGCIKKILYLLSRGIEAYPCIQFIVHSWMWMGTWLFFASNINMLSCSYVKCWSCVNHQLFQVCHFLLISCMWKHDLCFYDFFSFFVHFKTHLNVRI
jgi:hypothetical protein